MNGAPMATVLPAALPDSGDRLAALFDAHYNRLYALARRMAADAEAARDLVQETFLRAARAPASVPHGHAREEAWLVRVLINIRRDEWRRAEVRRRHREASGEVPRAARDHEAAAAAREIVWRALDALPPRRRAVVVLHELEGLTIAAVASLLGVSAITVRWHLSRGRRDLARLIAPLMEEP